MPRDPTPARSSPCCIGPRQSLVAYPGNRGLKTLVHTPFGICPVAQVSLQTRVRGIDVGRNRDRLVNRLCALRLMARFVARGDGSIGFDLARPSTGGLIDRLKRLAAGRHHRDQPSGQQGFNLHTANTRRVLSPITRPPPRERAKGRYRHDRDRDPHCRREDAVCYAAPRCLCLASCLRTDRQ